MKAYFSLVQPELKELQPGGTCSIWTARPPTPPCQPSLAPRASAKRSQSRAQLSSGVSNIRSLLTNNTACIAGSPAGAAAAAGATFRP
jgi:hypothetical protein